MPPQIAALLTSHNRRVKTLACLESLWAQIGLRSDFNLDVTLVDAGSTDGTAQAVRRRFPDARIISASDDVFWGEGMLRAFYAAPQTADYQLWLNDDVVLDPDAILRLLELKWRSSISVGQLRDREGKASYGGLRQKHRRPLTFSPIGISSTATKCDTFNGNVVLVSAEAAHRLGPIAGDWFPHAMGDIDYGLRAKSMDLHVLQAPGSVGLCDRNHVAQFRQADRLGERLRAATSVKQLPPRAWWRLCHRHAGIWLVPYFVKPYLSLLARSR